MMTFGSERLKGEVRESRKGGGEEKSGMDGATHMPRESRINCRL